MKKVHLKISLYLILLSLFLVKALYISPSYALTPGNFSGNNFGVLPDLSTTDISGKFTDPGFKQVVWEWLGNSGTPGKITKQDIVNRLADEGVNYELKIRNVNITTLAGIEYFEGLKKLWCPFDENNLSSIPVLPSTLKTLSCTRGKLSKLPTLPSGLEVLDCFGNRLSSLPALPNSLKYLDCYDNELTSLPSLPNTLKDLFCGKNLLTKLPSLPSELLLLDCSENRLTALPTLPNKLKYLNCGNNPLGSLSFLPESLQELRCQKNQLSNLPLLPESLQELSCQENWLSSLPVLPNGLAKLECENNKIRDLPDLPSSLRDLSCSDNLLTSLPALPNNMRMLNCGKNFLNIFAESFKANVSASTAYLLELEPQYRLSYTGEKIKLNKGETSQLTDFNLKIQMAYSGSTWYYFDDADLSNLTFSSSDERVAKVNSAGLITGQGAGTCSIYALLNGVDSNFTKAKIDVMVSVQIPGNTPGSVTIPGSTTPPGSITIPGSTTPESSTNIPPENAKPQDETTTGGDPTGGIEPSGTAELLIVMVIDSPTAFINGVAKSMDVPPTIINGRTMVPFRFVGELFGAEVEWFEESNTVMVELDGKVVSLVIGETGPGLDVPAQILNGRTMVPLRYIANALGGDVEWFPETRRVEIVK